MRTSARIADYRLWLPETDTDGSEIRAEAAAVAPLLRRRLSPLGRGAAEALFGVGAMGGDFAKAARDPETAWVFASRWGDLTRAVGELKRINAGENPSPAGFATSVHNGIEALLSLAARHTGAETAVAGGPFTFEAGFETAVGLLSEHPRVLLLCAEENLGAHFGSVRPSYALALLLEASRPQDFAYLAQGGDAPAKPVLTLFTRPLGKEETPDASKDDPAQTGVPEVFEWLFREADDTLTRRDRTVAHVWAKFGRLSEGGVR